MKRRGDADGVAALKKRVNKRIWVQYLDAATNKWVFYKNKEALSTGETYDTPAE